MGIFRTTTTPRPEEEKEETLSGIANVDNSEMNTKHNSVNDYSVNLNFISLHLNTLASSGALILIVLMLLLVARFCLTGGATRLLNRLLSISCLPVCCCPGSEPPGHLEPSAPTILILHFWHNLADFFIKHYFDIMNPKKSFVRQDFAPHSQSNLLKLGPV